MIYALNSLGSSNLLGGFKCYHRRLVDGVHISVFEISVNLKSNFSLLTILQITKEILYIFCPSL